MPWKQGGSDSGGRWAGGGRADSHGNARRMNRHCTVARPFETQQGPCCRTRRGWPLDWIWWGSSQGHAPVGSLAMDTAKHCVVFGSGLEIDACWIAARLHASRPGSPATVVVAAPVAVELCRGASVERLGRRGRGVKQLLACVVAPKMGKKRPTATLLAHGLLHQQLRPQREVVDGRWGPADGRLPHGGHLAPAPAPNADKHV